MITTPVATTRYDKTVPLLMRVGETVARYDLGRCLGLDWVR